MAVGIPNLDWITLDDGNEMPARLRLDAYESAWERRVADRATIKETQNLNIPFNSTSSGNTVDLTAANDTRQYSFTVTVPSVSKTVNSVGTITAKLQAKASASSTWVDVVTKQTSGTANDDAQGFQFTHLNDNASYDNWRLTITTTGGTLSIVNLTTFLDVSFTGNQRRRVENIIGSIETNHQSAFGDQMATLLSKTTLQNPIFYTAPNLEGRDMIRRRFLGTYSIDRISVDRGEGRSATILISLTSEGAWIDE